VADVIKAAKEYFYEKLKKGGFLVASGILEQRSGEVSLALEEAGFKIIRTEIFDGWCCLICQK